jgi:hypothetical protein
MSSSNPVSSLRFSLFILSEAKVTDCDQKSGEEFFVAPPQNDTARVG